MTTSIASGLTREQHLHFTEHGWVVLEGMLDEAQCAAYCEALDRSVGRFKALSMSAGETVQWVENVHLHEGLYLDWFKLPGILEANGRLLGVEPRLGATVAAVSAPHPERAARRDELTNPEMWLWHRDFRPRYGISQSDEDPELVNGNYLANITYLTPVGPGAGATALLDGSHRLDGSYATLKDRCEVVEPVAPAGSILIFSESLIHTPVPIVAETTRYALIFHMVAPWISGWPGSEVPPRFAKSLKDDTLRRLLSPPTGDDRSGHDYA